MPRNRNTPTTRFFARHIKWLIGVAVMLVLMVTLTLASKIYRSAVAEATLQQGKQQLEMAKSASLGIQFFFQHIQEELILLEMQFRNPPSQPLTQFLHDHSHASGRRGLTGFTGVVGDKSTLYYSDNTVNEWLPQLLQHGLRELDAGDYQSDIWVSDVLPSGDNGNSQELSFVVMKNIESQPAASRRSEREVAGFIIDFDWLVSQFAPVQSEGSTFIWIMDQDGKLLFHPRHPEMVLRSIFNADQSCHSCHASFEQQASLLVKENEYGLYQVSSESAKIMAQTSVRFSNRSWHVFVSTDIEEVTAVVRKNLVLFFWLVGFAVVGIIGGGLALLLLNTRRVRAEALAQHCQETRDLHEQLSQASQLASVGELVDSVAHEMNTPMGVMSASIEDLLLRQTTTADAESLRFVRSQIWRMSNCTQRLLRFSRRMSFELRPIDVVQMVEECLQLLRHRFREKKIKLKTNWPATLPPAWLDPDQMQQVLLNLLNNSVDAIAEQNRPGHVELALNVTNGFNGHKHDLMICVSDSGAGVRPADVPKLFDPFFTTKPVGKGTGLGLYISHSIVNRHRGAIEVEASQLGGARFAIHIPACIEPTPGIGHG